MKIQDYFQEVEMNQRKIEMRLRKMEKIPIISAALSEKEIKE